MREAARGSGDDETDEEKETLTRAEMVRRAQARVTGARIDQLAQDFDEQLDNGAGLRKAIQELLAREIITSATSKMSLDGVKGLVPWPCAKCDLFYRDAASTTCRGCGADFPE